MSMHRETVLENTADIVISARPGVLLTNQCGDQTWKQKVTNRMTRQQQYIAKKHNSVDDDKVDNFHDKRGKYKTTRRRRV